MLHFLDSFAEFVEYSRTVSSPKCAWTSALALNRETRGEDDNVQIFLLSLNTARGTNTQSKDYIISISTWPMINLTDALILSFRQFSDFRCVDVVELNQLKWSVTRSVSHLAEYVRQITDVTRHVQKQQQQQTYQLYCLHHVVYHYGGFMWPSTQHLIMMIMITPIETCSGVEK
jgi:hypothetical protein